MTASTPLTLTADSRSAEATQAPQGVRTPGHSPYARAVDGQIEEGPSNEALMEAYQQGDSGALRTLFKRYAPLILAIGRRHLRNETMAQDLVQQTFLRLHTARKDYKAERKLHPFLLTIAMNLVRDEWRRQKRRPTESLAHEPAVHDDSYDPDRQAQLRALQNALSSLSESDRLVIELHWFQDRDFPEVAEILGISQGAARVRAHRANNRLREAALRAAPQDDSEGRGRRRR